MGLVRRFCLGRIPAYVDGGLNIVDVRDVAAGHLLADEKGEVGERYILAGRNFTLDRLFADLVADLGRRAAAVEAAGRARARGRRGGHAGSGCRPRSPPEEIASASLWWTYRNTKAKRELGFEPRPHEETLEEAVAWQLEQLGGRAGRRRPRPAAALQGRSVASTAGAERMIVLYRCPTPTNVLCPCGAVERRLRKLGLEHETERLPYSAQAAPRDRGAHGPAAGAGAGRRRRGDPRLEANPASTWIGSTPSEKTA